ncbi:DUF4129 domain-containing protein [Fontisphaera persica]|uniref:DUF4129 domain-containing protein n=1 Tax=Fontisphaera persica TaxID=2974023 RepID=UPI0024BF1C62|nr:DUF4129 domain-containing protein [Fontisphaera persica]WCJ60850.1 DUF4129 domain-containing protein [Fontisphaera persica]
MAARPKTGQETGAWQLLEEALALLRRLPAPAWASYAAGVVPFVLGLLFFWGEMSQSALAERHLATAALGMALLFVWLKAWQAVFCDALLALQGCQAAQNWSLHRVARMVILQAAVQPWGFLAIPLALVAALPFAWVWAFFQNLSVVGHGHQSSLRATVLEAWRCACWAPRQNHYLLSLLTLTALVVLLNWISAFALVPYLLKAWLGIETWFTRSSVAYWNLTFFATVGALTWVTMDPLMKAVYTLRCFYTQARTSGADIKAELRRLQSAFTPLWLLWLGLLPLGACASENTPQITPPSGSLPAAQLDQALDRTLQQREFTWRMPRVETKASAGDNAGFLSAFFEEIAATIDAWWQGVSLTLDRFERWLDRLLGRRRLPGWTPDSDGVQTDWLSPLRVILVLLLGVMLFVLVKWLWRRHRQRLQTALAGQAAVETPAPRPDLQKEEVSPALLPEEEWLAMSRDFAARGEWRLALRALYLSALAGLARRELLALARGKSNREYVRELARKTHQHPGLLEPFQGLMQDFERVWYGRHAADAQLYQRCEEHLSHLQNA